MRCVKACLLVMVMLPGSGCSEPKITAQEPIRDSAKDLRIGSAPPYCQNLIVRPRRRRIARWTKEEGATELDLPCPRARCLSGSQAIFARYDEGGNLLVEVVGQAPMVFKGQQIRDSILGNYSGAVLSPDRKQMTLLAVDEAFHGTVVDIPARGEREHIDGVSVRGENVSLHIVTHQGTDGTQKRRRVILRGRADVFTMQISDGHRNQRGSIARKDGGWALEIDNFSRPIPSWSHFDPNQSSAWLAEKWVYLQSYPSYTIWPPNEEPFAADASEFGVLTTKYGAFRVRENVGVVRLTRTGEEVVIKREPGKDLGGRQLGPELHLERVLTTHAEEGLIWSERYRHRSCQIEDRLFFVDLKNLTTTPIASGPALRTPVVVNQGVVYWLEADVHLEMVSLDLGF